MATARVAFAPRTRLAPSPTGGLHLGNARTFALTWALARNEGWQVVLRIEDLDLDRVKSGAVDDTRRTLDWLGLDHDGAERQQSRDLEPYRAAMRRLAAQGAIFRCDRSRKDVRLAASAPHADDGETRYPPSLRPPRHGNSACNDETPATTSYAFFDGPHNHRFLVEPGAERVHDELAGNVEFDPGLEAGDFLVWTKLGVPSYQLAVVVDDLADGITDVVRGDDLLASAARQQLLYRALGSPSPRWWHLPLLHDESGVRLAKRHGATSLSALRESGVSRERVLGLLAFLAGLNPRRGELSLDDFRSLVTRDTLAALVVREGRTPARITPEDFAWLSKNSV
ncbi:MAG: tRNA glutamyl-Q(34) synthetase GluQRS [Phycisphaerae bacterium]|nr:tRNA glutamyl-Q(34) synthetase GluQRS [Phycisphaerae bacterium]